MVSTEFGRFCFQRDWKPSCFGHCSVVFFWKGLSPKKKTTPRQPGAVGSVAPWQTERFLSGWISKNSGKTTRTTPMKFNSSPLKSYSNPKMRSDRLAVPWFFQGAKRSTSGVYYLLAVSTMTWPPWTLNPGSLREFALFLHDPALDVREKMGCFRTSEGLQTVGFALKAWRPMASQRCFLPNLPAKPRVHIPPLLVGPQLVSFFEGFWVADAYPI